MTVGLKLIFRSGESFFEEPNDLRMPLHGFGLVSMESHRSFAKDSCIFWSISCSLFDLTLAFSVRPSSTTFDSLRKIVVLSGTCLVLRFVEKKKCICEYLRCHLRHRAASLLACFKKQCKDLKHTEISDDILFLAIHPLQPR